MTAGVLKLQMYRGDDRQFTVLVTDPENDDAPVDLTNIVNMRFTVKVSDLSEDVDALVTKEIGDGITIIDAVGGEALIEIEDTDTFDLFPMDYVADVQIVDGSNLVKTVAKGRFRLLADVTRTTP